MITLCTCLLHDIIYYARVWYGNNHRQVQNIVSGSTIYNIYDIM